MKKTFKLNDTYFKAGEEHYLVDKELPVKEGDIFTNGRVIGSPACKALIDHFTKHNLPIWPVVASTDKSLPVHHFTIPERVYSEEEMRDIATSFFRYWWNAPGNNTDEGFDKWFKIQSLNQIESIEVVYYSVNILGEPYFCVDNQSGELIVNVNYK